MMASGKLLIHSPVPTCSEHEREELAALCFTCIQRICEFCLKDKHFQHEWGAMARVIREVRNNAGERKIALLEILSSLKQASSNAALDNDIKRIDNVEARLHLMISEYANGLRSKMRKSNSDEDLPVEITDLEKMINFFAHHVHEAHDNVIFEMEEAFQRKCKIYEERKETIKPQCRFVEGKISEDVIADLFGRVVQDEKKGKEDETTGQNDRDDDNEWKQRIREDLTTIPSKESVLMDDAEKAETDGPPRKGIKRTITEVTTFRHGKDRITTIAPVSDTQAWIYEYLNRQCYCIDISGNVLDVRKTGLMEDFVVLDNENIIYTDSSQKVIRRSLPSSEFQKICSISKLKPASICRAHDGGLLVGLVECDALEITPNTRGEVRHMSLSGKAIRKYKRSKDGKTVLFTYTKRVAQNINKDICVIDIIKKDFTSRLVVLSVDGKVKFVYKGQPTLQGKFDSDDVCCDTFGRILVTDFQNNAVHQLSPDGEFLQLLLTKTNLTHHPKSIALRGENLWVGCKEGIVKLFRYH